MQNTDMLLYSSRADVPLSLLQAGLNPSGEGSATRVLRLHSALFSTSIRSSRKSSMLYFTTSIHLFLCLPLLRCPCTSASKILLTQSSSSRRCTCPNHLNLAVRTLADQSRRTWRGTKQWKCYEILPSESGVHSMLCSHSLLSEACPITQPLRNFGYTALRAATLTWLRHNVAPTHVRQ